MTNAVTYSTRSGLAAVLSLFALGLCGSAQAAETAFLKVNGQDIKLTSVNSGNASILQWKTITDDKKPLPITNGIKGLDKIAWETDGCIRISLNKGGQRDILTMASG